MIKKIRTYNISEQEKNRFGKHILPKHAESSFYYENIYSWINSKIMENVDVSFLWGGRPPDSYAAQYAIKSSKKLIILQHAKNARRKKFSFNYFFENKRKLFFWVLSIFLLKFLTLFKKNNICTEIKVYYFTDEYLNQWKKSLPRYHNVKYIKCSYPDVTKFGTEIDLKINYENIEAFLVDEPFNITLGISKEDELQLLENLSELLKDKKIYVKLHPRSNINKYKSLSNFIITTDIYKNANYLIGYNSALLDYSFNIKNFIKLVNLEWKKSSRSDLFKTTNYINDVKKGIENDL